MLTFCFKTILRVEKIDEAKWTPQASWVIENNDDKHDALGKKCWTFGGGDVGLSADDFPEELDYYADFKTMEGGLTGFVFHGSDGNNIYMHQVSTTGSGHTPQHIRWHRRVGGAWVGGTRSICRQRKSGSEWSGIVSSLRCERTTNLRHTSAMSAWEDADLALVSEWTDSAKAFEKGKIGYRMSRR